jgi:hypothetical protein
MDSDQQRLSFRHGVGQPLVAFLAPVLPLGLLLILLRRPPRDRRDWVIIPVELAGALVFGLAYTLLWTRLLKIHVSPEGIRCYNFWSVYRSIPWSDMARARPINLLGVRYLRVWTASPRSPIWIPLFLADMEGFKNAVLRFAGPANVVARHLTSSSP